MWPKHINIWAVLVSAAIYFVLGAFWYGFFGKAWMKELGKTEEQLKAGANPLLYAQAAAWALVSVFALAWLIGMTDANGLLPSLLVGFVVWLGFSAGTAAKHYAFSGASLRLFAIDYGYDLLCLTIASAILGLWR